MPAKNRSKKCDPPAAKEGNAVEPSVEPETSAESQVISTCSPCTDSAELRSSVAAPPPETAQGTDNKKVADDTMKVSVKGITRDTIPEDLSPREKKKLKNQLRLKEKKVQQRMDNEAIPKDTFAVERQSKLDKYQRVLAKMPVLSNMSPEDVLGTFTEQKQALDHLESEMTAALSDEERRTPRPPRGSMPTGKVLEEIKKLQSAPIAERDHVSLTMWMKAMESTVTFDGLQKFRAAISGLILNIEERRKQNDFAREQASTVVHRSSLVKRVNEIRAQRSLPGLAAEQVVSRVVELPGDAFTVLLGQNNHARRLERLFTVAVDTPSSRVSEGRRGPRSVTLAGAESHVTQLSRFVNETDWSGKASMKLDPRVRSAVIGRGGTGIRQLEEQNQCLMKIEDTGLLRVYGMPDKVEAVMAEVISIKDEVAQNNFQTVDVPVETVVARLVQRHPMIAAGLDTEFQCSLRVIFEGDDGRGHLNLRARANVIDSAKKSLENQLETMTVMSIPGEDMAVNRLVAARSPRKQTIRGRSPRSPAGAAGESRRLTSRSTANPVEMFTDMLENVTCVVEKKKTDDGSALLVAGPRDELEPLRGKIGELMQRVAMTRKLVYLNRNKYRSGGDDILALVAEETGAEVTFNRVITERSEVEISVVGTEEQKERAVALLQEYLQQRNYQEIYSLSSKFAADALRRDRFEKVNDWQQTFDVRISLTDSQVTIIGTEEAVGDALSQLKDFDAATSKYHASLETESVEIRNEDVKTVIGKKGASISNIRTSSGAEKVEIEEDDTSARVVIVGTTTSMIIAKKMLQQLLQRTSISREADPASRRPGQPSPRGRGGGRGRASGAGAGGTGNRNAGRKGQTGYMARSDSYEEHFPMLGSEDPAPIKKTDGAPHVQHQQRDIPDAPAVPAPSSEDPPMSDEDYEQKVGQQEGSPQLASSCGENMPEKVLVAAGAVDTGPTGGSKDW